MVAPGLKNFPNISSLLVPNQQHAIALHCRPRTLSQQENNAMADPIRAPSWVSIRRIFEQKLSDLHNCSNLSHVKQLHAQIIKADLHQDLYVVPKLVLAFSLCRQMSLAVNAFNQIQHPNVHLYNTLIRAHVQNSQQFQAFSAFFDMQLKGIPPDNFTYPFLLRGCGGGCSLRMVEMIHCHIEKFGFLGDIFVPNTLIDSYCKCGAAGLCSARKLFRGMGVRDIVTWNSIIGGLVKVGELEEARKLFDEMPEKDVVSCNTILDGYVKAGRMDVAFGLFESMPERTVVSWSTMISGYCEAGDMEMARVLFDRMPGKSLVSWTIIISGYAKKGLAKEAMCLYDEMLKVRSKPDEGALISILAACSESGLLQLGEKVHASMQLIRSMPSTRVYNALIDMYAKCGNMKRALDIFEGMTKRDIVSWNAIIHAMGIHGHEEKAIHLFCRMRIEGFQPDKVTFIGLLCACTHTGLVDKGIQYFYTMERDYGIIPEIEHYGCLIDLLGRGGRLREAFRTVQSMPMEPNAIIWGTLLGACRMQNAVGLAEEVLDCLSKLDPTDAGNFSVLSNIYASTGDWPSVANIRMQMKNIRIQKPSGASSIESHISAFGFWSWTSLVVLATSKHLSILGKES
ncbi:Pentatricopeptide repeat-containing protein At3g29230 [Dionaea muscipula]